jgi:RNA polymerase sigma-70 factor (ECF subfamily)
MTTYDTQITSPSLLQRLRHWPPDETAWEEFVRRYAPRISHWCQRWGLQPADIHDLTQEVLLALARQMAEFEYDAQRSFRAWLKTVTHRAWCRFVAHCQRRPQAGGAAVQALLDSVPAREDLMGQLEQESDWAMPIWPWRGSSGGSGAIPGKPFAYKPWKVCLGPKWPDV